MRRYLEYTVIAALIAFLSACGSAPTTQDAEVTPASFEKYPLHAGVYYSREFSEAKLGQGVERLGHAPYPVGAASLKAVDDALARLFVKVTRLESLSSEEMRNKGIDVVVVPTLEHLQIPIGFTGHKPNEHGVAYRTTLRTTKGVPLTSWVVHGTVSQWATVATGRGLVDVYINKAQAKYVDAFRREAGTTLAAVIARQELNVVPDDLTRVSVTAVQEDVPGVDPAEAALLKRLGVLTIRVVAKSPLERPVEVRASDMRLNFPDGPPIDPTPVSAITHLYVVAVRSRGVITPNPAVSAIGSMLVSGSAQGERYDTFKQAPATLAFGNRKLEADKAQDGVVWFLLDEATLPPGMTLTIWILDPAVPGGAAQVRVPVTTP